jgi:hypothetical protein
MRTQQNYHDILEHFKVEELKERLEFYMADDGGGWNKKKTKVKTKGGGSISAEKVKSKGEIGFSTPAPWTW